MNNVEKAPSVHGTVMAIDAIMTARSALRPMLGISWVIGENGTA